MRQSGTTRPTGKAGFSLGNTTICCPRSLEAEKRVFFNCFARRPARTRCLSRSRRQHAARQRQARGRFASSRSTSFQVCVVDVGLLAVSDFLHEPKKLHLLHLCTSVPQNSCSPLISLCDAFRRAFAACVTLRIFRRCGKSVSD